MIEDNRIEARQIRFWLEESRCGAFEVTWVQELKLGIQEISTGGIDVVVLDLNLPDSFGLETFFRFHQQVPETPVVVLTGAYDEATGELAIALGAQDYAMKKNADGTSLAYVIRYAVAQHRENLEQRTDEPLLHPVEMAVGNVF